MTVIERLKVADAHLSAEGYKEYSYPRLAISEAINVLISHDKENESEKGLILCLDVQNKRGQHLASGEI